MRAFQPVSLPRLAWLVKNEIRRATQRREYKYFCLFCEINWRNQINAKGSTPGAGQSSKAVGRREPGRLASLWVTAQPACPLSPGWSREGPGAREQPSAWTRWSIRVTRLPLSCVFCGNVRQRTRTWQG